jgi:hypothetical protein
MTAELAFWLVLAGFTIALIVLTYQYLTHDPAVCRTCVERAARRRHPAWRPVEDRDDWGTW